MNKPRIAVIGSLNVDYVLNLPRLPRPGETLAATSLAKFFGGKGANQSMACHLLGAQVTLHGAVGQDADGVEYCRYLEERGLSTKGIVSLPQTHTGMASIAVDAKAENSIVVAAGANGLLPDVLIDSFFEHALDYDALLLQFEIPRESVALILQKAALHSLPVIVNPSPWREDFPWGEFPIHSLIVNEHEASLLFHADIENLSIQQMQEALVKLKIDHLVITRGASSTWYITKSEHLEIPVYQVEPIDTVGAGDTFAGAYAANFHLPALERLLASNAAAAIATTKMGAQTGMPTHDEVLAFKSRHPLP